MRRLNCSWLANSIALCGLLGGAACSQAAPAPEAAQRYQLVDLTTCKKPRAAPPVAFKDSYEAYGLRRLFLNLDGSGNCVLIDFWIARLGGSPTAGMRMLEYRFMRVIRGKWQPFVTSLSYFPFAIKARSDGQVYLVDAPVVEDLGDMMVLDVGEAHVFTVAGWQREVGSLSELKLQKKVGKRNEVLLALAALLEAAPHQKSEVERARIRSLKSHAESSD